MFSKGEKSASGISILMWTAEKKFRNIQQVLSSAIEGEHDLRLQ
jgi:hypothetical protein